MIAGSPSWLPPASAGGQKPPRRYRQAVPAGINLSALQAANGRRRTLPSTVGCKPGGGLGPLRRKRSGQAQLRIIPPARNSASSGSGRLSRGTPAAVGGSIRMPSYRRPGALRAKDLASSVIKQQRSSGAPVSSRFSWPAPCPWQRPCRAAWAPPSCRPGWRPRCRQEVQHPGLGLSFFHGGTAYAPGKGARWPWRSRWAAQKREVPVADLPLFRQAAPEAPAAAAPASLIGGVRHPRPGCQAGFWARSPGGPAGARTISPALDFIPSPVSAHSPARHRLQTWDLPAQAASIQGGLHRDPGAIAVACIPLSRQGKGLFQLPLRRCCWGLSNAPQAGR